MTMKRISSIQGEDLFASDWRRTGTTWRREDSDSVVWGLRPEWGGAYEVSVRWGVSYRDGRRWPSFWMTFSWPFAGSLEQAQQYVDDTLRPWVTAVISSLPDKTPEGATA